MITHKDIKYVIVQSGGKGTRLGKYAMNRPKCLVPVYGKPMIDQTLEVYKDKTVIIIGDTHFKMLLQYICNISSHDNYILLQTEEEGTAAGIKSALQNIPDGEPFIITWSDLFFGKEQEFEFDTEMLVGLAGDFDCRWSLENGIFKNVSSQERGVSGFFVFRNKERFAKLTTDKSLVRGFLSDNYMPYEISSFVNQKCFEVGTVEKYEEILSKEINHRFFNEVKIEYDKVYKKCVDLKYENVHQAEKDWYEYVKDSFTRIPIIYSTDPLIMSRVEGKHAWEIKSNKDWVIENYCGALQQLHSIKGSCEPLGDYDCADTYMFKPYQRVMEVKSIIEDFSKPVIEINRKSCRNPFCDMRSFEKIMENNLLKNIHYTVIHGDCTFSNTLVDDKNQVWFIDPRGTFGGSKIYGDPRYDWAKLYYSAVGNYDKINSKKFSVDRSNGVKLDIESNGYGHFGDYIIQRSKMTKVEMLLLHAGIWFSLSGYVKEDIEAVLYSFYKGCEIWTEAITLI
jgi:GTP:adenosylcobinamide-phosphate guanylyltransferase/aminoglycoside phosphotransferase